MEQEIRINEYAKPLTSLQEKLTEDLEPAGEIYSIRLYGTDEHPMLDKVQDWLKSNGWAHSKDELGTPMYLSRNHGKRNIMYLPYPDDPASAIQCVLDDRNFNSFTDFVREDEDLQVTMLNHRGKAYDLTEFEYAMLLHKKQEVIDDWMKLQVEKMPSLTPSDLAQQFRREGGIERPSGLYFGEGISDPEYKWARMEIQNLVDRGELALKNTRDRDGYGVVRLELPKQKEPKWKDVSNEKGTFCLAKETTAETVLLSMDDHNHVTAKAVASNKKPKIIYKGKSLNEGMREAESYLLKTPTISR